MILLKKNNYNRDGYQGKRAAILMQKGGKQYGRALTPQVETPVPIRGQVIPEKGGIFTDDEFYDLYDRYMTPGQGFVQYGQKIKGSGEGGIGCLGTCRRNLKTLYPQFEDLTTLFSKKGLYNKGVNTTAGERAGETVGVDSWELPYIMQREGLGKMQFMFRHDNPGRQKYLQEKFKYQSLPVGTMLSFGDAVKAGYVDKSAVDQLAKVKNMPLPRHTAMVQGFVEGIDAEGNPVVDILIDDLGQLRRIGHSTEAHDIPESYFEDLVGATTRNDMSHLTYERLKALKK